MLKYEPRQGDIRVLLDGKHVGTIKPVLNGWRYYAKGSKIAGDCFASLAACKRSLEPQPLSSQDGANHD